MGVPGNLQVRKLQGSACLDLFLSKQLEGTLQLANGRDMRKIGYVVKNRIEYIIWYKSCFLLIEVLFILKAL